MKDGIKEIIDYLRKYIDNEETGEIIESKHTMNLLLDYITNLQEENERLNNIIDEKDYKIKRLVYSCYESDMSYGEFKAIWVNAFEKLYDPKDIDKLENELKRR